MRPRGTCWTQPVSATELLKSNTLAVQLARQARDSVSADGSIYIAGSISTVRDAIPFKHTEGNRLGRGTANEQIPAAKSKANYREQAQLLAEAGVDLIMLER